MKNAILAILGVFVLSPAFACDGCAPPSTVQTEFVLKAPMSFDYDYVLIKEIKAEAKEFSVSKPIVSTSVTFVVPSTRLGFVYRNVDYESCSDDLCVGGFRNHNYEPLNTNATHAIINPSEPKLPDIIEKNGFHDRCFV